MDKAAELEQSHGFQKVYPLLKVDSRTRTVYGIITDETPDKANPPEICDYDSSKPYYEIGRAHV